MNELGLPDLAYDQRFYESKSRREHAPLVAPLVESRIAGREKQELFEALGTLRVVGGMVLTTEEIFAIGPAAVAARIRERVGDRPAFISFDIDVVDPAFAPGTGTPEAGGPSAHDMLTVLRGLTGIDFIGFDVVEVIPAYDPAGQTATLAANLAYEMLSLLARRRAGA